MTVFLNMITIVILVLILSGKNLSTILTNNENERAFPSVAGAYNNDEDYDIGNQRNQGVYSADSSLILTFRINIKKKQILINYVVIVFGLMMT